MSVDGRRLRFYESHYRKQSAELSAQEMADQQHRLSAAGYDGRKTVLTLEEMSHLRVLRPILLATIPKRIRKQSIRNGKVKIMVQNGVAVRPSSVVSINSARRAPKIQESVHKPKAA